MQTASGKPKHGGGAATREKLTARPLNGGSDSESENADSGAGVSASEIAEKAASEVGTASTKRPCGMKRAVQNAGQFAALERGVKGVENFAANGEKSF